MIEELDTRDIHQAMEEVRGVPTHLIKHCALIVGMTINELELFYCGIKGHVAKVCRSKREVYQVVITGDASLESVGSVGIKHLQGQQATHCGSLSGGTWVGNEMEVDSGASVSIISVSVYKYTFPKAKLEHCNVTLKAVAGDSLKVIEKIQVTLIEANGQKFGLPCYCTNKQHHSSAGTGSMLEVFANLAAGQVFTMLALSNAYQQLEVGLESRKYLTIHSPQSLPVNSSTIWCGKCTNNLPVGHGQSIAMVRGCDVFIVCRFFKKSVAYLGHKMDDNDGIHPTSQKVKSIVPAAVTKLWDWSLECQAAFDWSKHMRTSNQLLAHFDRTLPIVVACDVSPYGVGAVLCHRVNREEKLVVFASKHLSEKIYSQIDRVTLAITIKHFHKYLYGRKFTLLTSSAFT
ncbi:hypothetical protein PR048_021020 [Dryococelus australis]|uniref:Reverse transcriptase/retrotransposon-derived protein RNase H-like domain-containing protein n=1 Tax=Dryococelus australis TaxID=614101 RepID=A0ABQ9GX20_9NEOP|nr:hypothetical protein PR048_021020 [Dryococelus australis]